MKKIMFFLGKGGVGKSTISSATASTLSKTQKTLLVSLDPAHNIGDIFGITLNNKVKRISDNLDASEVDIQSWIDRYLRHSRQEMKEHYSYNVTINMDSFFNIMKYSPGTEEYAVLWAIEHIYTEHKDSYATIIFDTPPTALTLRFLAMPTISLRWVKELSSMREKILQKRSTIMRLNPNSENPKGALSKKDDKVYTKLSSIHGRLEELYRIFTQESYITVVLNEDTLSLAESIRICKELKKLDVYISSLCVNKTGKLPHDVYRDRIKDEFNDMPIFSSPLVAADGVTVQSLASVDIADLLDNYANS